MQEILKNQTLAALATLNQCIKNCPDTEWNESHGDAPFSQAVFHTLFHVDYLLSVDKEDFMSQKFHCGHKELFRNYGEFEHEGYAEVYSKDEIAIYLDFCLNKIKERFCGTNKIDVLEKSEFWEMTVLELSIDNIRHIQHHAAQLGLRLQQISGERLKWAASGWE